MSRVEVIIAVHRTTRPITTAIESVLNGNTTGAARHTQVRVVCHNISTDQIAAQVSPQLRRRVRWLEHHDGIASASGPFNAGMRASDAEFVSLLGSDDVLQPGAVGSWLELAQATGADCVQTRLAIGTQARLVPTPPIRSLRRLPRRHPALADPVFDRLSYRSAPLGLVSTSACRALGVELAEGMPVGGDVPYVTRLWCETTVAVDSAGPAYVIGEGARDRVTYQTRPISEELRFVRHLLAATWFTAYPPDVRAAVATKLLRIHVFGAISNRPDARWWTGAERSALAAIAADVLAAAPGVADPLSRADHAVIDAILDPGMPARGLIECAAARRRHGRPATLIPRQVSHIAHRAAPPRFLAASWWASR
ncbi:hypothetical protein BH23ACT6_BH23ACT6_13420 [soil metagenome]